MGGSQEPSSCEGFQTLKKSLRAGVSTLALPVRDLYWQDEAQSLPATGGLTNISSDQKFVLGKQKQALDEGLELVGTPRAQRRPDLARLAPATQTQHRKWERQ